MLRGVVPPLEPRERDRAHPAFRPEHGPAKPAPRCRLARALRLDESLLEPTQIVQHIASKEPGHRNKGEKIVGLMALELR